MGFNDYLAVLMFVLGFFLDFVEISVILLPLLIPPLILMGHDPIWLAVLAGDALIVLAFETLADAAASAPERLPGLLRTLGGSVGLPSGICAGQAWECEPNGVPLDKYEQLKTGSLFAAATVIGAEAAGRDGTAWRTLGAKLGEAYQVADDIRDVYADADEPENFYVEKILDGATVEEQLALVQYAASDLERRMNDRVLDLVREADLKPREGALFLEQYRRAFQEYTYVSRDPGAGKKAPVRGKRIRRRQ